MSAADLASYMYNKLRGSNTLNSPSIGDMSSLRTSTSPNPRLTTVWRTKEDVQDERHRKSSFKEDSSFLRLLRAKSMPSIVQEGGSPGRYSAPGALPYSLNKSVSATLNQSSSSSIMSPITSRHVNPKREFYADDFPDSSSNASIVTPPPSPCSFTTLQGKLTRSASDGQIMKERRRELRKNNIDFPTDGMPSVRDLRRRFDNPQNANSVPDIKRKTSFKSFNSQKENQSVQNNVQIITANSENSPQATTTKPVNIINSSTPNSERDELKQLQHKKLVRHESLKRWEPQQSECQPKTEDIDIPLKSVKNLSRQFESNGPQNSDNDTLMFNERQSRSVVNSVPTQSLSVSKESQDNWTFDQCQQDYEDMNKIEVKLRNKSAPPNRICQRESVVNIPPLVNKMKMQFENQDVSGRDFTPNSALGINGKPQHKQVKYTKSDQKSDFEIKEQKHEERILNTGIQSKNAEHKRENSLPDIQLEIKSKLDNNSVSGSQTEKSADSYEQAMENQECPKSPGVKHLRKQFEKASVTKSSSTKFTEKDIPEQAVRNITQSQVQFWTKPEPEGMKITRQESTELKDNSQDITSSTLSVRDLLKQFESKSSMKNEMDDIFTYKSNDNDDRFVIRQEPSTQATDFDNSMEITNKKVNVKEEDSEEEFYDESILLSLGDGDEGSSGEKSPEMLVECSKRGLLKRNFSQRESSDEFSSEDEKSSVKERANEYLYYEEVSKTKQAEEQRQKEVEEQQRRGQMEEERSKAETDQNQRMEMEVTKDRSSVQRSREELIMEFNVHDDFENEQEKINQEQLERDKAEKAKHEQQRKEEERAHEERLKLEKMAREKAEQERKERKAKEWMAEQERVEREKVEKERIEKEKAEQERAEREKAEKEQMEKEMAEEELREKERVEQERIVKEKAEQERMAMENAEKERMEKEKAKERQIQEQLERDKEEKERREKERRKLEETEQMDKREERRTEPGEQQGTTEMELRDKKWAENERLKREEETRELQERRKVGALVDKFMTTEEPREHQKERGGSIKLEDNEQPEVKVGHLIDKFVNNRGISDDVRPSELPKIPKLERKESDVALLIDKFANTKRRTSSSSSHSSDGGKEAAPIPKVTTKNIPGKTRGLREDEMKFFMQGPGAMETFTRSQSMRVKNKEPAPFQQRGGSVRVKSSKENPPAGNPKSMPKTCRQLRPDELRFFDMSNNKNIYPVQKAKAKNTKDSKQDFRLVSQGNQGGGLERGFPGDDQKFSTVYDTDSDSDASLLRGEDEDENSSDEALILQQEHLSLNITSHCDSDEGDHEAHNLSLTNIDHEFLGDPGMESLIDDQPELEWIPNTQPHRHLDFLSLPAGDEQETLKHDSPEGGNQEYTGNEDNVYCNASLNTDSIENHQCDIPKIVVGMELSSSTCISNIENEEENLCNIKTEDSDKNQTIFTENVGSSSDDSDNDPGLLKPEKLDIGEHTYTLQLPNVSEKMVGQTAVSIAMNQNLAQDLEKDILENNGALLSPGDNPKQEYIEEIKQGPRNAQDPVEVYSEEIEVSKDDSRNIQDNVEVQFKEMEVILQDPRSNQEPVELHVEEVNLSTDDPRNKQNNAEVHFKDIEAIKQDPRRNQNSVDVSIEDLEVNIDNSGNTQDPIKEIRSKDDAKDNQGPVEVHIEEKEERKDDAKDNQGPVEPSTDEDSDSDVRPVENYILHIDQSQEYLSDKEFAVFCIMVACFSVVVYFIYDFIF